MRRVTRLCVVATLGMLLGFVLSTGALGVVLTVNSTADDLTAGDGKTQLQQATSISQMT
jgi:hypothetical protein